MNSKQLNITRKSKFTFKATGHTAQAMSTNPTTTTSTTHPTVTFTCKVG